MRGVVIGEKVVARFNRMPAILQESLEKGIARACLRVVARTKQDKLSGQVLRVVTGRLRRSINMRVAVEGSAVTGYVGTNVEYAHRQEFGFTGTESVRAHVRRLASGKVASVRGFARNVNYPAHSFLRTALDELQQQIRDDITAGVNEAIAKGQQ